MQQAPVLRHKRPAPWRSEQTLTSEGNGGHHCNKRVRKKEKKEKKSFSLRLQNTTHQPTPPRLRRPQANLLSRVRKRQDSTQVTVDFGGWCKSTRHTHTLIDPSNQPTHGVIFFVSFGPAGSTLPSIDVETRAVAATRACCCSSGWRLIHGRGSQVSCERCVAVNSGEERRIRSLSDLCAGPRALAARRASRACSGDCQIVDSGRLPPGEAMLTLNLRVQTSVEASILVVDQVDAVLVA